jgi:hypothetical protein
LFPTISSSTAPHPINLLAFVLDLKDCFGQSPRNEGFVVLGGDVLMAAKANVRELKAKCCKSLWVFDNSTQHHKPMTKI